MGRNGDAERTLSALMQAAQAGDTAAYRDFLAAVIPHIRMVVRARRLGFAAADVEDLVQDVLLSIHSVRQTWDSGRPILPWIAAIVRNRLADAARRHRRRAANETPAGDDYETFPAPPANRENGIGDAEALRAAISVLPPGQRSAIELLKLKEMTLKEAASVTGLSIAALKVAVHRGLKALRDALTTPRASP